MNRKLIFLTRSQIFLHSLRNGTSGDYIVSVTAVVIFLLIIWGYI